MTSRIESDSSAWLSSSSSACSSKFRPSNALFWSSSMASGLIILLVVYTESSGLPRLSHESKYTVGFCFRSI